MKFYVLAFLLSLTSGYEEMVPVVRDYIRMVEFDSQLNTYVIGQSQSFYKLNKNHTTERIEKFYWILKILINKNDDVFIFTNADGNESGSGATVASVYRSRPYFDTSEFLFNYSRTYIGEIPDFYPRMNYFIDKEDNIIFNTLEGVSLFRSRKNTPMPIAIVNLEDYYFDLYAEDEAGNVYLSSPTYRSNSIAIITNSAKKKFVPDAIFHLISENSLITSFLLWNEDLILLDQNKVWRLKNEGAGSINTELILYQYNSSYYIPGSYSGRLFIGSSDQISNICHFQMLTSGNELITAEGAPFCYYLSAFTKEGTGIFLAQETCGYSLYVINHNETKFIDAHYCIPNGEVFKDIKADDNGNVWTLGFLSNATHLLGHLYAVPKRSIDPILVYESSFTATSDSFMKFKKETKEIFLAVGNGLYVVSNIY